MINFKEEEELEIYGISINIPLYQREKTKINIFERILLKDFKNENIEHEEDTENVFIPFFTFQKGYFIEKSIF
jgi:hypothetical protein